MNRYYEAAEQHQLATLATINSIRDPGRRGGSSSTERVHWMDDLHVLRRAIPFYWSARCVDMVLQLQKDFDLREIAASRELVPVDFAYHYFEKPPFVVKDVSGAVCDVTGITWACCSTMPKPEQPPEKLLALTAYCAASKTSNKPLSMLWCSRSIGKPMLVQNEVLETGQDETSSQEIEALVRFCVVGGTFLRQKLLKEESQRIERHARKRLQKEGYPRDHVSVVYMRKLETSSHFQAATGESQREYDFQWSVRGHSRNQWYPSLSEHLPIYIHPYLKGPEDKPLKPRSTPLVVVNR